MYSNIQIIYLIILFLVATYSIFLCKNGKKQQEFLCIYMSITFCLEFLMFIFQIFFKSSADFGFLYNLYILFCAIFFLMYFNKKQGRSLKRINNIVFLVFSLIYVFFIIKNHREISQVIGISFALIYIIYSLIWFYSKIKDPNLNSIANDPKFWVSCGLLFWGVFFILRIIPRYLFNEVDREILIVSQSFFFVINIFFYVSFFISLLKYKKRYDE